MLRKPHTNGIILTGRSPGSGLKDFELEKLKAMTISEMEEAYQQLHGQLLRGELDEEEFKAEVEKLRFEDELGHQWKIGWYTGKWYRYDQGQWVQGTPVDRQTPVTPPPAAGGPPAEEKEPKGRPGTFWLAAVLIVLLLLSSVVLIIGWNTDWWTQQTGDATTVSEAGPTTEGTSAPTESPNPTESTKDVAATNEAATRVARASATTRPTSTPAPTRRPATSTPTTKPPTLTAAPTETATEPPAATPTTETSPEPTTQPTAKAQALSGRILFPVYDPNPDRQTFDVHAVDLESGDREVVLGQASQPALSPDGDRLAYRSWDGARRGILVRELTDGNTWVWVRFAEAERPSWSPNSQNLVFPSQQESDRQWRVYRTRGLEIDRVRRHGGDILGRVPIWLADDRIVYWECPLDKCGLYVMRSDGTDPIRLTMGEHDTSPAASPDGSQVAYMSKQDGNWEVYVVGTQPPGGQEPKRLTKDGARDGLPVWSPNGKWLAFVTDRNGAWEVWVMRPDGSGQRKLFDLGGPLEGTIADAPPGEQHGWTWETLVWQP